ncbi:MAG: quinone oxidoreductase [Hyphomicrobiaceae bacterium]|nr:MAG: quinone oxidoreductase [Hyphomicrobiaceae bacterium]
MKAVQVHSFGGPDALAVEELPVPTPGKGEVLVKLELAGVNYIDVYMRNGSYGRSETYRTPLPMTLGMEGGGSVAALGTDTGTVAVGDRVAYCLARGSYAEYAVVPEGKLVRVPDDIPMHIATALMLQGATAHYLTHSAFRLTSQHVCLVHAGAGGVGQLLIQLAKRNGAYVIATVGTREKAALAKARGADATILYREADFREEVLRLTSGRGVDVVYDSVGRDTLPRSLRSLKRRGTCISFGASSGQPEPITLLELAEAGSVFLTRPHLADYMASPEEIGGRASDLFKAVGEGALSVAIDSTLPLANARRAHELIEGRTTRGKLLLDIAA